MKNAPAELSPSSTASLSFPAAQEPVIGVDESAAAARMGLKLGAVLFLTMLPVTMMVPVLKELVSERFNASSFWAHFFMSINMVAAVLTAPLTGAFADRLARRKPLLVACLASNGVLLLLMSLAPRLGWLLALRFVEGAVHVLAVSTVMAMACDWVGPARRGRMMGLIGSALIFGTACGAPLGGRIGSSAPTLVFHLGAGFSLLAAVLAMVGLRDAHDRTAVAGVADALRLLRTCRNLLVPYAYSFVDRFCVGVIVSSFVLFLGEVHSLSPAQRGGLLALFLFPFALLCYPVGRLVDRYGRVVPMVGGNLAFGVAFALYGFVPASLLPALMLASGLFSAILFSPNLALCSDLAPLEQRATAYAGFNMAGSLGFMAGPLIGGLVHVLVKPGLGAVAAYQVTFVIAGLAVVLCAVTLLPALRRLRTEGKTS